MWIKICANTNLADCETALDAGADALGFIFAPSKRRVTEEQAAAITRALPATIEKVGVFTSANADDIATTATIAGLTMVQMHSAYDPALVARLSEFFAGKIKLMQVITYEATSIDASTPDTNADQAFVNTLRTVIDDPRLWAVLLDASRAGASGGLGIAFDWNHVAHLIEHALAERSNHPRVLLAGGLTPENVAEAINILHPFGVDVVSGVEASAGHKNPDRVRAFIHAGRAKR
jgi:phosphoribosylanthranilate isomerase